MKKVILPFFLLFVLTGTIFSQGIYLRAGTGYSLPVATTTFGQMHLQVYDASGTTVINSNSSESIKGSLGAGMNFNFALGYKFNENFIFDLNVQYLIGNKIVTGDKYSYFYPDTSGVDNYTKTTSAKGFLFNPAVIFSAGFGKAAPYGRFGVVVASPSITESEASYYDLDGISQYERIWVYSKGMALGYSAAVGMNWKLTDKLDIYTEANFISMTYYPAEGEMTKYNSNGNDLLPNMYVSQKQIKFEKKYDPQASTDFTKPTVQPLRSFAFSSASVEVGIRFTIWKKAD
jgi:hypothetical protein